LWRAPQVGSYEAAQQGYAGKRRFNLEIGNEDKNPFLD